MSEKSKNWYYRAYIITAIIAWILCILPTAIAGYIKLPQIVAIKNVESTTETVLTGSAIVVLICCAYPLLKGVLKAFKSPSAYLILWIIFFMSLLLYKIPHETLGAFVLVFCVAAIGNTVGAILFFISKKFKEKWTVLNK